MSWRDKFSAWSKLLFFISGVAVTIIVWLFFYQPNRELPAQGRVLLMPGVLENSLLPQLKAVPPSTTQVPKLPGAALRNSAEQASEVVEDIPKPGTVANPPVPEAVGEPPESGTTENAPVPETVEGPPEPGMVENPPVPELNKESPESGAIENSTVSKVTKS